MNKIIFETIGNVIMFVLLALFFTVGLTIEIAEGGVTLSANIFVVALLVYMLLYGIVLLVWNRKQGASFHHLISGMQMHLEIDERESVITYKAAKTAYTTTVISVPLALFAFACVHYVGVGFDMYIVGCWLFTLICIAVNSAYSIAWCFEYTR